VSDSVVDSISVGPRRSAQERELWLDMFANFCESIMGSTLEEHRGLKEYPVDQLKSDIVLAAELADHALSEAAYRMMKNKPEVKRRELRVRR